MTGRVDRAIAVVEAVQALLAGEEVDLEGPHVSARGARLEAPRPVQERIPLTVGTSNRRLLRFAGERADVVGLAGLGRTLPDGHSHTVRWSPAQVDEQVALVRAAAVGRAPLPQHEALVQLFEVTDDAERVLAPFAKEIGTSVEDLGTVPYVLVGTVEEIVAAVAEHRRRWGIDGYVVRAADRLDALAAVLPGLTRL